MIYNAEHILEKILKKYEGTLEAIVAETAIWANPSLHRELLEAGNIALYPNVRRARAGKGERRGDIKGIERLDDNTYANNAIKRVIGASRNDIVGYEACHIWGKTCYDKRYHTAIANLVLLPRALASLTDHYAPIQKILQYRAYELYEWYPEGENAPQKPINYSLLHWRKPERHSSLVRSKKNSLQKRGQSIEEKIIIWQGKPTLSVHKIISLVLANEGIDKSKLIHLIKSQKISINPYGAINSLKTNAGNAYGAVLQEKDNRIYFLPDAKIALRKSKWLAIKC